MIPESVKIGGIVYTVRQDVDELLDQGGNDGCIRYGPQEIWIRSTIADDYKHQAFLHEVIHGALDIVGNAEWRSNEQLVNGLANVLHQVLRDNNLRFGDEEPKGQRCPLKPPGVKAYESIDGMWKVE